jgi:DNA-binding CsgD family transcriptional regulator
MFSSRRGNRVDISNLRRAVFKPAFGRAGVPWATFHTLRHTCASLLVANGYSVKQVQVYLGHANAGFTLETYIHLFSDDLPTPAGFAPICAPNVDLPPPKPLHHGRDDQPKIGRLSPLPLEFRLTSHERTQRRLNRLSPRQREVLEGLRQGMATTELASAMGVAEETVRSHVTAILQTLGVHSRLQAVALANDSAPDPARPNPPSERSCRNLAAPG